MAKPGRSVAEDACMALPEGEESNIATICASDTSAPIKDRLRSRFAVLRPMELASFMKPDISANSSAAGKFSSVQSLSGVGSLTNCLSTYAKKN